MSPPTSAIPAVPSGDDIESPVTDVRALLDGPLSGGHLIAGGDGLDRHVQRTRSLAELDTFRSGSLVFAPSRPNGRPLDLAHFNAAVLNGASAMCIPSRSRIISAVRERADEVQLPVIELPADAPLRERRRQVDAFLLARRDADSDIRSIVGAAIVQSLAREVDLAQLLQIAGEALGSELIVQRTNGRRLAAGGRSIHRETNDADETVELPIVVGTSQAATLVATEPLALRHDRSSSILQALAAAVGGLLDDHADNADPRDRERQLLRDIVGDDLAGRERAFRHARGLPSFPHAPLQVLVVQAVGPTLRPDGLRRLAHHIESEVIATDQHALVATVDGAVSIVLSGGVDTARLVRLLSRRLGLPLVFGAGRTVPDLRRLPTAHRQAMRAASLGRRIRRAGTLLTYDDLGAYQLLSIIPEHERVTFASHVLGRFATDDRAAAELRRTLRVLLDENFNIARAARRLFVHYNTMRYRVEKLTEDLGDLQHDADRRLAVQMALAVLRLDAESSQLAGSDGS